jgi:hypothetical protein
MTESRSKGTRFGFSLRMPKKTILSKKAIKAKLLESGHWAEAVQYRESLKRGGMAADEAWAAMEEKYMPLYEAWAAKHKHDTVVLNHLTADKENCFTKSRKFKKAVRPNLRDDADWIYLNLADPEREIRDPPSEGAMAALMHFRTHREEFYQMYFSRLLPTRAVVDGESTKADNGKSVLELIGGMRERFKPGQPDDSVLPAGAEGIGGEPGVSGAITNDSSKELGYTVGSLDDVPA